MVANAQLEDFPIVFVSDKFTGKMGYTRADLIGQPVTLDFMGNKEVSQMLQQYLVNISRTSTKLLPQLEEGPSFQTEGNHKTDNLPRSTSGNTNGNHWENIWEQVGTHG